MPHTSHTPHTSQPSQEAITGTGATNEAGHAAAMRAGVDAVPGARLSTPAWVLWLLFSINAVNYLDRLLVVAVGPTLKTEFHLTDRDVGLLSSAFLVVYTLSALPIGILADRWARARVVAAGVALWSLFSGFTAVTHSIGGLFITRAAVGIGEASYFPAGIALLSAYYPIEKRARAMSRWGAGQLVGTALAFVLSAALYRWLGVGLGWRVAFVITAIPGLVLAALIWLVRDTPPRTVSIAPATPAAPISVAPNAPNAPNAPHTPAAASSRAPLLRDVASRIRYVLSIRTVWLGIVLQALTYVVISPTLVFLPIYLRSPRSGFHITPAETSLLSGVIIVVGGLCGVLLGGHIADWLSARLHGGRVVAVSVGFGAALPCYATTLLTHSLALFVVAGTLAVLTLNIQVGPLGAIVQDATPPALRSTAVAVGLLLSHLLGDAWAPTAVGALSTALGERTGMALLIIGAPALLLAALAGIFGARIYAGDVAARTRGSARGEMPA